MLATMGAAVLTSIAADSRARPPEPMPRPTSATETGSPAPMTEPKASSRISRAAITPISSP